MTTRLLLLIFAVAVAAIARAQDWPQFRGPEGNGIARSSKLPTRWSATENVKWKVPIHGRAWSSPVVGNGQIWLTSASEDGKQLFVLTVDLATGKITRDLKVFDVEKPQFAHSFNTYASPTPVVQDGRVYVTFGSPGTACLDASSGKVLWTRRDLECNHFRGAGSSPVVYGNLLFMNFDGSDLQYVVALDKATGQTVWKRNRSVDFQDLGPDGKPELEGDYRKAFATCHVAELDGMPVLLSPGSKAFYAYEPATGTELWRVEERTSYSASTRPVVGKGLVYTPSGFASGQLLAIRPGKKGEVVDAKDTSTPTQLKVVWRVKKHVPKKPSLLFMNDLLYAVEDNGVATCWDPGNGDVIWSERIGGKFSASPLGAGEHIYLFSEEGKTTVLKAGRALEKVAENELPDGFMASPAVARDALILRTRTTLYKIEQQ